MPIIMQEKPSVFNRGVNKLKIRGCIKINLIQSDKKKEENS